MIERSYPSAGVWHTIHARQQQGGGGAAGRHAPRQDKCQYHTIAQTKKHNKHYTPIIIIKKQNILTAINKHLTL